MNIACLRGACAFLILLFTAPLIRPAEDNAKPTCDNLKGEWVNELGSTLTIENVDPATGKIEGKYKSPSGAGNKDFPLIGWVNEAKKEDKGDNVKVISFTVRWGEFGSITSWTGYCQTIDAKPTLVMQWHLVRPNSSFNWDHVLTNQDRFTPK